MDLTMDKSKKGIKRKAYLVREKLDMISRVKGGESQAKVVRETGINESTLRGWLRDEGKLLDYAASMDSDVGLALKVVSYHKSRCITWSYCQIFSGIGI